MMIGVCFITAGPNSVHSNVEDLILLGYDHARTTQSALENCGNTHYKCYHKKNNPGPFHLGLMTADTVFMSPTGGHQKSCFRTKFFLRAADLQ